jgi:SAM-dependent methyltransferase
MAAYLEDRGPDVHQTSLRAPFGIVARRLRAVVGDLVTEAALPAGAVVVDYGCADMPYRDLLPGVDYRGVDLPGNPKATVELTADGRVPLPDGTADLVLSTQVLEHVRDPRLYLEECARLLRPGGTLVLSTHGIMYLHRDPTDYWRWTCDGLALVVEDAGLEVGEVRGVLGLAGAALQLLQPVIVRRLPRPLRVGVVALFQVLIASTERVTSEVGRRENGLVLAVRATKPALTP